MKRAAFFTLGCRVNQYETEAIIESFVKDGYNIVDFEDFAEVYVVNTCSVTSISDKKSRKMLRKVKKINPESVVVAAGCYVQVSAEEVSAIEGVDIVVGTENKGKIPQMVSEFQKNKIQIVSVGNIMDIRTFEELQIENYIDKRRAFLKIQDGCDRFCSYCMIPYARGPVRSREPNPILAEVEKLSRNGFKEIILSGIHVASYGKDLGQMNLVDIIERVNTVSGIERIRIGSVEPMFFTPENVQRLSQLEKFCPHFHLSLQSGSNNTLKRMNRKYTKEDYGVTVDRIRRFFPESSITTDIIVGFPGETESEFEETYAFLEKIKLSKMHIFKYSPRKGTKAAMLPDQINPEVKEFRSNQLLELNKRNEADFVRQYVGKVVEVLFEGKSADSDRVMGYTRNYLQVEVKSLLKLSGRMQEVKIIEATAGRGIGIPFIRKIQR